MIKFNGDELFEQLSLFFSGPKSRDADKQLKTNLQLLNPNCAMTLGTRADATSRLGMMRRANEHWTLQTESFRISDLEYDFDRFKQFLIFSELHIGCTKKD